MWESWSRHITPTPRLSCGCCAIGSIAAVPRSRSAWSRAPTGILRSRPRGGWGGPSRYTFRNGRATLCFERCARYLIENHESLRPAFGSHNVRSLAHAIAAAEVRGLPKSAYELQTLFGMGDAIQKVLVDRGHRVRVYTPYGAILPGMAYLVRRLLENTSNESFLKASLAEKTPVDVLLRDPEEIGAMLTRNRRTRNEATATPARGELSPFRNEPPVDFARRENREAMRQAIESVRLRLGRSYALSIDGHEFETSGRWLDSIDPGHSSRIVGQFAPGRGPGTPRPRSRRLGRHSRRGPRLQHRSAQRS